MPNKISLIALKRLGSLAIFIFLIYLIGFIKTGFIGDLTKFLEQNLGLLILATILLMIGEIVMTLRAPIIWSTPLFNAFGSIAIVAFVINVIQFSFITLNLDVTLVTKILSFILYPLVFAIVLIVGCVTIFNKERKHKKHRKKTV